MDWIVALKGDEIDLQELAKVWNSPELTIEKGVTSYILKSTHFVSLTSNEEVREKANELLIPINAGIKFLLGATKPIQIAHTTQIYPNGAKMSYQLCYKVLPLRAACSGETVTIDGKKEIQNPADDIIYLSKIAQSDCQVTKVCQYINQDFDDRGNLYKIYEVIYKDGFTPLQRKGKYEKKAEIFRRTINNPSSSGLNSRHAMDDAPPEIPMTQSELKDFIRMVIQEWLETKMNKNT